MMNYTSQKRIQRMQLKCTLVLIVCIVGVNGQFFTKSTKNIPRMGRRSPMSEFVDSGDSSGATGHQSLYGELIDIYGPKLLAEARLNKGTSTYASSFGDRQPSEQQFEADPLQHNYLDSSDPGYYWVQK